MQTIVIGGINEYIVLSTLIIQILIPYDDQWNAKFTETEHWTKAFVKPKSFVAVYENNITLTPSTKNITTFILTFAIKTLKSFWTTPYFSQFNPSFFVETQT